LKQKFERLKAAGDIIDHSEKALLSYKRFDGNCTFCGKKGHKTKDCFFKKQNNQKKKNQRRNKQIFNGRCFKCGKYGHRIEDCYHMKKNQDNNGMAEEKGGVALMMLSEKDSFHCYDCEPVIHSEMCLTNNEDIIAEELMIADTGATVHIRKNTNNMFDIKEEPFIVKYGNGTYSTSSKTGKWAGVIENNG
jgi:hypothetical protein